MSNLEPMFDNATRVHETQVAMNLIYVISLIFDVWSWAEKVNILITATYVPGEKFRCK